MNPSEAERQIAQMVEFIKQEANEKAEEIRVKTEQEFNIQKLEYIEQAKIHIKEDFEKKKLEELMKKRIERSSLVNASRLAKVKRRNDVVEKIKDETKEKLAEASKNPKYKDLLVALIVQGLIRLKESDVTVRVRAEDSSVAQQILSNAESEYKKVMKRDTGLDVSVKLKLDTEHLPAGPTGDRTRFSCAGGVVLVCNKGRIVLDNTLDRRLDLAYEELKPTIRKLVFN